MIRNCRRSTISASAPAGTANRKIGKVVAAWTMETMNGSGLRSVISQPDAALYIQPPILEITVAPHTTEKLAWRNGLQGELALPLAGVGFVLMLKSSPND